MKREDLLKLSVTPEEIHVRTLLIKEEIRDSSPNLRRANFTRIAPADLRQLFGLYDDLFFDSFFSRELVNQIRFQLSSRMTKAAGTVQWKKGSKSYTIKISTHLLFRNFDGSVDRDVVVAGIECADRIEAMQRTFEHEICHLIELVTMGRTSCSQEHFRRLACRLFGHTRGTHDLVTASEIAREKHGIRVGGRVRFQHMGASREGIVSRITKRATVMVEDPRGQFQNTRGERFVKFYVPLSLLRPVA